jgi:Protein of unknown function (DUF2599)
MRALTIAASALAVLLAAAPASADASGPPYVDHVGWSQSNQLPTLRVYPTASGRATAKQLGSAGPDADEAWAEVLALAPDANTPGMREQFLCHWEWAEVMQPGKLSWNLEPWRPVVDAATMASSGCNPGGAEESF